MYPRFLTKCLRMSQFVQITHSHQYVVPFHTKKLFTTLRVNSPSFSGRIVPLFDTMLVYQGEGSGTPTKPHHTPFPEDRATIAKSSTLPRDSAPWVTSPTTEEGRVIRDKSGDDSPIKGRSNNEGEAVAERISNDSEEIARVLTSMDAATILAGETNVPTGSGFIPTVGPKGKGNYGGVEDFIPMGSKEEAKRIKRKGINLEKEQVKKQKSSEEAPETKTPTKEFTEEKIKEMMQLVPVEVMYVQALQVKHPIIDWKVHSEGERSYWQIIRLGGSSACY
nr:hypothetical protein [Tanacetum cinerariifolium]